MPGKGQTITLYATSDSKTAAPRKRESRKMFDRGTPRKNMPPTRAIAGNLQIRMRGSAARPGLVTILREKY